MEAVDRILARVVHDPKTECWAWPGGKAGAGYGVTHERVSLGKFKTVYVHRVMYEQFVGSIPEGLEIDHLCRNLLCCNPAHLEAVTHAENRRRARLSHCKHGHALEGLNVYYLKGIRRGCQTCRRTQHRIPSYAHA